MEGWKQCKIHFPGSQSDAIVNACDELFAAAGSPPEMALFERSDEVEKGGNVPRGERRIYLLSPAASKFTASLEGTWNDCPKPDEFNWSLIVGNGQSHDLLGLRKPVASESQLDKIRKGEQ